MKLCINEVSDSLDSDTTPKSKQPSNCQKIATDDPLDAHWD